MRLGVAHVPTGPHEIDFVWNAFLHFPAAVRRPPGGRNKRKWQRGRR